MAAAAGAPGSGEGGEAEPDSEPISGDDRPRQELAEAPEPHAPVVEELGWEQELVTEEAGHEETELRLPDTEELPECIGPEVTHWESEEQEHPAALEASPEAWRDMEAEGVVDSGENGVLADVLTSEEPMQLGEDFACSPAPCNEGPAPEALVAEETSVSEGSLSTPEHPLIMCAPSPPPQITSDSSHCMFEPVVQEIQVLVPEIYHPELAEEAESEYALIQDELESPLDHLQIELSAPVELMGSPVLESTTIETEEASDSLPRMETPDPDPVLQVQEPMLEMDDDLTPLVEDLPVPEPVIPESEVMLDLQEEMACIVDEDTIPEVTEVEEISRSVDIVADSVQELFTETSDPVDVDSKYVPEPFQKDEEQIHELDFVEDNTVHPESMQCMDVKLLLQPEEGSDSRDVHVVSPETEHQSDGSSEQASAPLIMSEDLHSLSERALEEAVSPMDSGISSELTSVEKELDSQSGHEPSVENSSDCTKLESYSQDVDYDPFYRDTKTEDCVEEREESPVVSTDDVQTGELTSEEPVLSATKADVEACMDSPDPRLSVTGGIDDLVPGSEVQVTLDHIIQDALVVSFRHGDRIFSGVLMDLSKRFGPHGIPVTIHPKREYKNKPEEPVQPQSTSFQEESSVKNENGTGPMDETPIQPTEPCGVNNNLWTSKPPPLFHEGAPYPPPLFIRDTYNQSIPQPPPRKIKRLKKKIYREEPTSIMNAIKLRPRQVLCDKCKNVVTDKREVRKTGSDSFKLEEGKRRRHESVTTVNKKLKTDHKVNGKSQSEGPKKNPGSKVSNLAHGRKVVKVSSQTNASKSQLHTKKVLQSKNMDHAKAREVLKMAKEKAQKKQKDTSSSKNAHGKVHFTRRLQNTTSGTLPPRLRIKPQRYRNEENDSSLKIGLESLRSSKNGIKPQTRYTATRSAGEAPSEIKTPTNGPEEVSSAIENTSVCVPPGEQDEQQALSKRGGKSNITVYMTLNQKKADSSSASVCSSDSTDDLKSTHSECSSTENFDFPPGSMHAPSSSSSSSSKEEKKLSNSLKIKVFSKNVTKCVTPDGRTICVGDIVWAKIYGFPWWPARILAITVSRKDNGLLVRQEASISWFGSPTTSYLALSQLSPFLENFQSRFNKKRKGLYRKAITEAAKAAKQLTPEVRALLTQFET